MVDVIDAAPEQPRRSTPVRMGRYLHDESLIESFDNRYGYSWVVSPDCKQREIEAWIGDDKETIYLRQEVNACPQFPQGTVDIISVTLGQAYDLLRVITRALEV